MADARTYGYSDIQRYLQHKMSPQEMHAFEKALMNDPFLADAMEGFLKSDAALAEKHLTSIRQEITGEKQEGKVVALPLQKTRWWRVAAIVLIVVTGGIFTYSLFNKNTTPKNTADVQISSPEATEMAQKADSVGPADRPLARVELESKRGIAELKNTSPIIHETPGAAKDAAQATTTDTDFGGIATTKESNEAALASKAYNEEKLRSARAMMARPSTAGNPSAMADAETYKEFKGRVTDKNGEPVAGAAIIINNTDTATVTDTNGNFSLRAPDSSLSITVSSIGRAPKRFELKDVIPLNNIIVETTTSPQAEVVVTGLNLKKAKPKTIRSNKDDDAQPKGGWKNFDEYVNGKTDSLKASDNGVNYDGKVELEFSIDDEGRPVDIKVLNEKDRTTAQKAVEILKNGPSWKKKKNKKVKVIIPF